MLVLSRKLNESLIIDDDVIITVVEIRDNKVRLGITAPREKSVHRQEVWIEIHGQTMDAAGSLPVGARRRPLNHGGR